MLDLRAVHKLRRVAKQEPQGVGNTACAAVDGRLRRTRTNLNDVAVVDIFLARISAGQLLQSLYTHLHVHQTATACVPVTAVCVLG